jgi:hypothetical protein
VSAYPYLTEFAVTLGCTLLVLVLATCWFLVTTKGER